LLKQNITNAVTFKIITALSSFLVVPLFTYSGIISNYDAGLAFTAVFMLLSLANFRYLNIFANKSSRLGHRYEHIQIKLIHTRTIWFMVLFSTAFLMEREAKKVTYLRLSKTFINGILGLSLFAFILFVFGEDFYSLWSGHNIAKFKYEALLIVLASLFAVLWNSPALLFIANSIYYEFTAHYLTPITASLSSQIILAKTEFLYYQLPTTDNRNFYAYSSSRKFQTEFRNK